MRIGLNALFFIPGGLAGIGVYTTNLVRHLASLAPQHDYVLFVSKEGAGFWADFSNCLRIVVVPTPARIRPFRVLAEQFLLPFYVQNEELDLLHSLAFTAPLFLPCASVVSILDLGFRHWSGRFSRIAVLVQNALVPAAARASSHLITISESAKAEIVSELGIQPSKISVTYLACDREHFHPHGSNEQMLQRDLKARYRFQTPYILSIASSYPHKNLDGLIRAYALLVTEQQIDHQLVLVGHRRKAQQQLLDLIDHLDLNHRVILTGFVPKVDLPLLYSLADLFVFPSFYEGFGIPPLEAMACGTPVVSSNATSLPEVVDDAACLVNPHDVRAMANSMLGLLTDPGLRSEMIRRGLERASQFSWVKTAHDTLAVYQSVVELGQR